MLTVSENWIQISDKRVGADMEKKNAHSIDSFMLDRNDGLQTGRGVARSMGVAFNAPPMRYIRGSQAPGGRRQVRQRRVSVQQRPPDYRVIAAWSGFLVLIGAAAFALGMAIHYEAHAKQALRPTPIYYCSTGAEMPIYEPCKEMKGQREV